MTRTACAAIACMAIFLSAGVAGGVQDPDDVYAVPKTWMFDHTLGPPAPEKGDDYFMADSNPRVREWLALVQGRHASESQRELVRNGQYGPAIEDCRYTLERFPNHPLALSLIVEIAKALEQPTKPIAFFENALRFYPQHAYTHAQYGRYLLDIGAESAGISELEIAVRLDPNMFQARAWLMEAKGHTAEEAAPMPADSTQQGSIVSPNRVYKTPRN